MSAMALGMGLLLILFGFGAGWILPKTGAWMNHIQVLFGFMVIGTAIFLASTLNGFPVLYSWGGLLLITGFLSLVDRSRCGSRKLPPRCYLVCFVLWPPVPYSGALCVSLAAARVVVMCCDH